MPETGIHSLTNVGPRKAKITNVGMTYGPRKRRRAALISVGIPDIEHPWETLRFVVYTSQGYKKIIQPESDVLQQLHELVSKLPALANGNQHSRVNYRRKYVPALHRW